MKTRIKLSVVLTIFLTMITGGCGSSPSASGHDELDLAIRDASDYLNDNIPEGNMIVILNMQSDSAALSDYIIDELIANAVNDRILKVVDRQQLDLIRTEQNFQLSGEVDDKLALSIGKIFGAQTIVSGRVRQLDDRYRMTIRALEVQTAQVQGQYNRNIAGGKTITALMKSGGGSGGKTQSTTTKTTGSSNSGTTQASPTTPVAPVNTAPASSPPITGTMVPGSSLTEKLAWLQRSADSHNIYILEVSTDESITPHTFYYEGAINITIVLRGDNANRTIRLRSSGNMFTVHSNITFILDNNITIHGHDNNSGTMVYVNGGIFRMRTGSIIIGNIRNTGNGGGVFVDSGTFEMSGGTISGNAARNGGGVFVQEMSGKFTIRDGTISGNTANEGGGVYANGNFTMYGGTITSNTARENGGGVYAGPWTDSFIKGGGTITGYASDPSNGNVIRDIFGNVLARRGHAVYSISGAGQVGLRKETTAGPGLNLKSHTSGGWDN